jgi:hypothetical protein
MVPLGLVDYIKSEEVSRIDWSWPKPVRQVTGNGGEEPSFTERWGDCFCFSSANPTSPHLSRGSKIEESGDEYQYSRSYYCKI